MRVKEVRAARVWLRLCLAAGVVITSTSCGGARLPLPATSAAPVSAGGAIDAATVARCTQMFGEPTQSPYQLPFLPGRSFTMFQGYCPPDPRWGHNGWLAYDFDLAIGDQIVASREGTVTFVEQRWPKAVTSE